MAGQPRVNRASKTSPSITSSSSQTTSPESATGSNRDDRSKPRLQSSFVPKDSSELTLLPTMRIECMRRSMLSMTTDHYSLCWPAWPLYSALVQHGLMQGTSCPEATEDAPSPREYLSLPEPLRPTPLQLATVHKRWIDRFPFPRLRDNLILLNGLVDLEEFIQDLFGMASLLLRSEVRRATWDPVSWTISPEFGRKWGYLFL